MSDIFQEVEEDVRRERYEEIWKKYGNFIIAGAAVIVLAVAGYQAWKTYDLNQRQKFSDQFEAAQALAATGDAAKAETAFADLAKTAPQGYAVLAKFQEASALLAQGKRDPAMALLRELIASNDPMISNPARLRMAWMIADAAARPEVAQMLQPLSQPDSPWRYSAAEVMAYLDFMQGARGDAQAAYDKLAQDTAAPPSLRNRATAIATYLKANPNPTPASPTPAAAPAPAPAPAPAAPPAPAAQRPAAPRPAAPAQRTRTP